MDELPPEMAAAWRAREAEDARREIEPEAEPEPEPDYDHAPDSAHSIEAAEAPPRRRSPILAFVTLPVVLIAVAVTWALGLAGWRGGPALVTVGLTAFALAAGLLLTRSQHLRVAYLGGGLVVALVGAAWCVSTAPLSHGRLEQVLDRVPNSVLITSKTSRSGHGWCQPRCPTVSRVYSLPAQRPGTAMRSAVVAMQSAGMIPRDAARVALSRALGFASQGDPIVIDNQTYTTVVRVRPDPSPEASGGSLVTLEVTSRRGVKTIPASPARGR